MSIIDNETRFYRKQDSELYVATFGDDNNTIFNFLTGGYLPFSKIIFKPYNWAGGSYEAFDSREDFIKYLNDNYFEDITENFRKNINN